MTARRADEHDLIADVVVAGAGAAGLAAAVAARSAGATVIVIDENVDVGGHAILSGGWVRLGGGHSLQRAMAIEDRAAAVYDDWLRDPNSTFNDRALVKAFADANVDTFEFLVDHGVRFLDGPPDHLSVDVTPRRMFQAQEWPDPEGVIAPNRGRNGSGVVRPLQRSAQQRGVQFHFEHGLKSLVREEMSGAVTGLVAATHNGERRIHARKGIVLATGGHTSHVGFRRMFDPRLTQEYQVAGEPYSRQSAASELAALAIGGSLWGAGAQTSGDTLAIAKTSQIGCRYGYRFLVFEPGSRMFPQARAIGLPVTDWSNVILVAGRGRRFWNESDDSRAFLDAALSSGDLPSGHNGGGPIWAIFDSAHAAREGWILEPPYVDPEGYFFSADVVSELATAVTNQFQSQQLDPDTLHETVLRYNTFVAGGVDEDFGKSGLNHPLAEPPFHAAWATPMLHDSLTGLRTDETCAVLDVSGEPIRGLYCAGEAQGGFSQHALSRCLVFGRIAGLTASGNID